MSWQAVKAVLEHSGAKGAPLLTLVVVAERADADGIAWPSVEDIGGRAKQLPRQAERHLRTLIEAGELEIVRPGGGAGCSNHYRVTAVAKMQSDATPDSTPGRPMAELHEAKNPGVFAGVSNGRNPVGLGAEPRRLGRQTPAIEAQNPGVFAGGTSRTSVEPSIEPSDSVEDLARMLSGGAGAAGGKNVGPVVFQIQELLAACGCDVSFRKTVADWGNVRVVRKLAKEFDRKRKTIKNPGGWWRDRLRREGMQGI